MIAVPPRNKTSLTWWERGSAAITRGIVNNDAFLLALVGLIIVLGLRSLSR